MGRMPWKRGKMKRKLPDKFSVFSNDISEVLCTEQEIQARIMEMGQQIAADYAGLQPVLVGALKGVMCLMADLIRAIPLPVEVDFLAVSSYTREARDRGMVRVVKDLDSSIMDRHVIFVEDIIDTGLTLNYLLRSLRTRQPASLEVLTLFDRPTRRLIEVPVRYRGFELPDLYVVGYGLDYQEKYRNLPFVGVLDPKVLFGDKKPA